MNHTPAETVPVAVLVAELQTLDPSALVTSYTVRLRVGSASVLLDYSGVRNMRERKLARMTNHQRAALRPPSYPRMDQRRQWQVDKRLDLLDWDGVTP